MEQFDIYPSNPHSKRRSIVSRTLDQFENEGSPNDVWLRVRLTPNEEADLVDHLNRELDADASASNSVLNRRRRSISMNPSNSSVPRYHFIRTKKNDNFDDSIDFWPADDEDNMAVSEMSNLIYLNPPNFVSSLKTRYTLASSSIKQLTSLQDDDAAAILPDNDESNIECFYSSLGPVLLAVNPNTPIPQLYDNKQIERVWNSRENDRFNKKSTPHPFVIADRALRRMSECAENQCIVISGQSGAGKTETSKHLLKYLTTISARNSAELQSPKITDSPIRQSLNSFQTSGGLETRILRSNPILESFGNASTFRNYNSSRFGRLINLLFNNNMVIEKCAIDTCLLAKSRVVMSPDGEQNYHVLHCLADYVADQCAKRKTEDIDMENLCILNEFVQDEFTHFGEEKAMEVWGAGSSGFKCTRTSSIDEVGERAVVPYSFEELVTSFKEMNVNNDEQLVIFRILAAILHLGNLVFTNEPSTENATIDEYGHLILKRVQNLLSMDDDVDLYGKFVTRLLTIGRETIEKKLGPDTAQHEKKKLVMNLYELLFKVVVKLINQSICSNSDASSASPTTTDDYGDPEYLKSLQLNKIALLDIYGFEDMKPEGSNGFEQLCINYANEVLQDIFREQFLTDEMKLYKAEGISTVIKESPQENHGLKSAFSCRQLGIWTLLNQQSEVSTTRLSTHTHPDRVFCEMVNSKTAQEYPNVILNANKSRVGDTLMINHYSGDVIYDVNGFIDRNQDVFLRKEMLQILKDKSFKSCSESQTVKFMMKLMEKSGSVNNGQKSIGFASNATIFLQQLMRLKTDLDNTNKWFIRCIKPNRVQSPGYFDDELVAEQLISGGLLQVLDIMKNGYPCRIQYSTLYMKCEQYLNGHKFIPKDFANLVQRHFSIPDEDCRLGKTQIFLRLNGWKVFEKIQSMNEDETRSFSNSISKLQSARTIFLFLQTSMKKKVNLIGNSYKRYQARKSLLRLRGYVWHMLIPCYHLDRVVSLIYPRTDRNLIRSAFNSIYQDYSTKLAEARRNKAKQALEEAAQLLKIAEEERKSAMEKISTLPVASADSPVDQNIEAELAQREQELIKREEVILLKEKDAERKLQKAKEYLRFSGRTSFSETSDGYSEDVADENTNLDKIRSRGSLSPSSHLKPRTKGIRNSLNNKDCPHRIRNSTRIGKGKVEGKSGPLGHEYGYHTSTRAKMRGCKENSSHGSVEEPISCRTPERGTMSKAVSQGNTPFAGHRSHGQNELPTGSLKRSLSGSAMVNDQGTKKAKLN